MLYTVCGNLSNARAAVVRLDVAPVKLHVCLKLMAQMVGDGDSSQHVKSTILEDLKKVKPFH